MLSGIHARYTLFGVVFGTAFPLGALALDIGIHVGFSDIRRMMSDPVFLVVCTAPLVLGFTFSVIGRARAALQAQLDLTLAQEAALWRIANEDSLTGQGNRHSLMTTLACLDAPSHLLLIDLDKFKFVNDTLGHHVGDALLRAFSERLLERLPEGADLFRLGGDEFVVLLRNGTAENATSFARDVIACLSRPFLLAGTRVVIGGSVGIAAADPAQTSPTEALERADLALYRAKQTFGNEFCTYDASMSEAATLRLSLEADIRHGIEQDTFFLEYQPIVNLDTGRVRGFEALVRWRHPQRGLLAPDTFIPIAEVSGLIIPLGQHILRLACREAARWPAPLSVAVNVSVEQFKQRSFCDQVLAALDESGLPPGRLVLEITESLFILDIDMVSLSFDRLKQLGVRFALDDYGTGYSSINHLRQLDLDYIKLDRSFAKSALADPREQSVVRSIVELGESFGLTATAEGIETVEELDLMRAKGVTDAQGFLFARPLAATAIPAFLAGEARPSLGRTA